MTLFFIGKASYPHETMTTGLSFVSFFFRDNDYFMYNAIHNFHYFHRDNRTRERLVIFVIADEINSIVELAVAVLQAVVNKIENI